MAQNKQFRSGPVALTTTTTTNILNPGVTSMAGPVGITIGQPYLLLKKVTIVNKTGSAATFSLWIGATGANAAGTEYLGIGTSVAANSRVELFVNTRLDSADFLVGGSNTATALSIEIEGEVGISG